MRLALLLPVCSDFSEVAVEQAWKAAQEPKNFSLIVGTENVASARILKFRGERPHIWVNPEWTKEWMLSSLYISVFSEAY